MDRADEALETGAKFIAAACPFCNTMMSDGVKNREKEAEVAVLDIAEMIAESMV
jgi:Fe-S oxidoreductase